MLLNKYFLQAIWRKIQELGLIVKKKKIEKEKKKEFTLIKHSSIESETPSRSVLMSVSKETEEHGELIETL
ncbi:hypothetical protein BpHYR1_034375 [Brachionus plicatilis]|uniref:Uncharacterized protein n=1 Tax=Brachionus plicatilis TaxID=10195 RepID=A0A3M7SW20_BRAPC|nr:hypothetical protein BpHYR1_034375 [Brachionus plicatilis]